MYPVRYYCPRCETLVTLQREGYLADKSVTPFPLEGWSYVDVGDDYDEADGVRVVCGESGALPSDADDDLGSSIDGDGDPATFEAEGCGEAYYLNFVRFEDGNEVEPVRESRHVELAADGPGGPDGPSWPGE